MWTTMTTVTRRTPTSTSTTCARSEHTCTLVDVCLLCHWYITLHIGSSRPWVRHCHLHTIHDERFLLSCSTSPFTSSRSSPSFPVLPLHALRQLWLRDKQPAQLRQRDLRHLRRYLPAHRLWAQRHGAQRLGPQQVQWLPGSPRPLYSVVRPRHKVILLLGGAGKEHGGLLIIRGMIFRIHFFLQLDRLQLTAVYCNRREV